MAEKNLPANSLSGSEASNVAPKLVNGVVLLVALTIFGLLNAWVIVNGRPASLDLHLDFFGVLSAAAVVTNLVAVALLYRNKVRNDIILWLTIFLLSVAYWAASDSMFKLSSTRASAVFWDPFTTIGAIYVPVALYMFTLAYTGSRRSKSLSVFPLLAGVSALIIFTDAHTHLITLYTVAATNVTHWGFEVKTGPAYAVFATWIVLLTASSVALLVRYRRQTVEAGMRHQTKLFIIAILIPLIIGSVTDGILPGLNLDVLPSLVVVFLTITGAIISYGIYKLDFVRFSPELVSSRILNTITDAVIGLTPDLKISYANYGTGRLLGVPIEDLAYHSLDDFVVSDTTSLLSQQITDKLKDTDFYSLESVDFQTAYNSIISTKVSITKIVSDDEPYGYLVVLTDVTAITKARERVEKEVTERTLQLHEEQARLWASIEGLKDGFALVDSQSKIVVQNKALRQLFDLDERIASVDQLDKLLDKLDLAAKIRQIQNDGHTFRLNEISLGLKTIQIFMGPVNIDENGQSRTIGTVLLVEDTTEADILERSRDEFFSIASHELRTPLTGIRGNSSMILNYYQDMLSDPQLKEMLEDIHTSSVRLIELVNDFLDVSRLEQGKMSFAYSAVSTGKVVENVASEMKATLADKNITLAADEPGLKALPKVWADSNRLEQVIYNLLGNAAKFTEQGEIVVKGEFISDKDLVKIIVSDTGRGMSAESQQLLFHKFQQASPSLITRDTTRGTGLGLYISKMIIEGMGGEIKLERSEENKGSSFSFTVPAATPERRESQRSEMTVNTTTGRSSKVSQ
jgi:signal transduction histidine kinase